MNGVEDGVPVLIGLYPAHGADPSRPLVGGIGGSGDRLRKFAGLSLNEYARSFDRVNLIYDLAGREKHPGIEEMRLAAFELKITYEGLRVIFLGESVARAFGFDRKPYRWVRPFGPFAAAAKIPHPSGKNRVLNDPAEQRRFGRFLRATGARR